MLAMCKAHASRMTFVLGRYFPNDTGLNQKKQFNRAPPVRQRRMVLEQGIARQTLGRSLTLAHNVRPLAKVFYAIIENFKNLS